MGIEEEIKSLEKALKQDTDVVVGINQLFKDSFSDISKEKLEQHDVDIRTRLIQPEISAMSVSNFLGSIKFRGLKSAKMLGGKKSKDVKIAMTESLSILMFQLKRHKISLEGKSRAEIIDILKGAIERQDEKRGFFGSLFKPKSTDGA